ncbi:OLC1v1036076C1 [Oldenlandia corymbosa var. corymbosa]|uniref:OLC1v1036076C1 n=1 Tax=Oldenlandia corymbosa var. corymbosa TaxID=529605 RepID=A0AAV1CVV9_OLDCO|nr:OLC1v1036076C1 [Oldenlandia corymbosa var. corymbosa]
MRDALDQILQTPVHKTSKQTSRNRSINEKHGNCFGSCGANWCETEKWFLVRPNNCYQFCSRKTSNFHIGKCSGTSNSNRISLGTFVFKNLLDIRWQKLADIRFVVFTSFLRKSRMYGEAGGVPADIGALLIRGKHNYGTANDFAIARLIRGQTKFFYPCRAAFATSHGIHFGQAKPLSQPWKTSRIHGANNSTLREKDRSPLNFQGFDRTHHFKSHDHEFEKFIDQAELEPNFRF